MASPGPDLSKLRIDRGRGEQRRGGRLAWVLLLLVSLASGAYVARQEGLLDRWLGAPRPRVNVAVATRTGGAPARAGISANGYVVARRQAALSTDVQGRLVELLVEEGTRVAEGDLIARLDTRQLEAARDRAAAELERARASFDLARTEFERQDNLLPTGDTSVSDRDMALATRDEAAAWVGSMEAALQEIDVQLDKSSVYAPFAGVITAKNAEVGEVVSAVSAAGPNARGAVATLVDFDTLEVQVELAQKSLSAARPGAPVEIFLDAWPTDGYSGRVRQIWPTADRQKATVEVRAVFLERDERILPEMGVRVVFLEGEEQAATPPRVLVPAAALLGTGSERAVLVVVDGVLVRRAVSLAGEPVAGQAEIAAGLAGGEQVVLDPDPALVEGQAVEVGGGR